MKTANMSHGVSIVADAAAARVTILVENVDELDPDVILSQAWIQLAEAISQRKQARLESEGPGHPTGNVTWWSE